MTILTFETPILLEILTEILRRLDDISPETNLRVSLRSNAFVEKIAIFPAVPDGKKTLMEDLANEFGASLVM